MNTYQEKCEAQYLELQEVKQENEKLKKQLKNAEEIVYTQARGIEKQNTYIDKIEQENEKLKKDFDYISVLFSDISKKNELNESRALSRSLMLNEYGKKINELKQENEKLKLVVENLHNQLNCSYFHPIQYRPFTCDKCGFVRSELKAIDDKIKEIK